MEKPFYGSIAIRLVVSNSNPFEFDSCVMCGDAVHYKSLPAHSQRVILRGKKMIRPEHLTNCAGELLKIE